MIVARVDLGHIQPEARAGAVVEVVRLRIALAHRAHLGARTLLRRRAARHFIAPLSLPEIYFIFPGSTQAVFRLVAAQVAQVRLT